tara:strand:+ start:423 stop:863 length:441 start_codon:yes stop_codon:yes gene_type:complete
MIVIQQHLGGHFTPIHYPRISIKNYIAKQSKTLFDLEKLDEFNVVFDTHYEFQIPFRTRIHKDLKSKYDYIVNKDEKYTLMLIPAITLQFSYCESLMDERIATDPHMVIWKDLISLRGKNEYLMLNLLERVSFKKKPKKKTRRKGK